MSNIGITVILVILIGWLFGMIFAWIDAIKENESLLHRIFEIESRYYSLDNRYYELRSDVKKLKSQLYTAEGGEEYGRFCRSNSKEK